MVTVWVLKYVVLSVRLITKEVVATFVNGRGEFWLTWTLYDPGREVWPDEKLGPGYDAESVNDVSPNPVVWEIGLEL